MREEAILCKAVKQDSLGMTDSLMAKLRIYSFIQEDNKFFAYFKH